MENKILSCPHCNQLQCFVERENEIDAYLCLSCGYTTNSTFKIDSDQIDEWEKNTPMLIRESRFLDKKSNLIWYPSVLNFPSKGIIFPDGTSELNWNWRVAKIIQISEDDKSNFPIPGKPGKFYSSKLDIDNSTLYDRNDFKGACKDLGILNES